MPGRHQSIWAQIILRGPLYVLTDTCFAPVHLYPVGICIAQDQYTPILFICQGPASKGRETLGNFKVECS
jgi:hypothetical protein